MLHAGRLKNTIRAGPTTPPASPRHDVDGAPATPSTPPPGNSSSRGGSGRRHGQREAMIGTEGKDDTAVFTPTATTKRTAGSAGARTRGAGTGASSKKKRSRRRRISTLESAASQAMESRLEQEEWYAERRKVNEERRVRKEKELAAAKESRRAAAASVPTCGAGNEGRWRDRRAGPRGSVPAPPTARRTSRKARGCPRPTCGWVSSSPGVSCSVCPAARAPEERIHDHGQRLCFACHRPACNKGFAHLYPQGVNTAISLVDECKSGDRTLPACIIKGFRPASDCYCRRPDCFYEFLRAESRDGARRTCHECGDVGRKEKRWFKVPPGDGSGAVKWACRVCYSKDVGRKRGSTSTPPSEVPAILRGPPRQRPEAIVQKEVESSVAGGDLVHWEDAYRRLAEERTAAGHGTTSPQYGRRLVRNMFYAIAEANGSKARVVCEDGGVVGVDGREKILCLFPNALRDDALLKYVVEAREAAKEGAKSELERALKRVEDNPKDVRGRMAVVMVAGAIVRRDVEGDSSLRNAPARGKEHRYGEELAMPVKPVREALAGYPETLVGMLQSVTLMPLIGDVVGGDPPASQPGWVREQAWRKDVLAEKEEEASAGGRDDGIPQT